MMLKICSWSFLTTFVYLTRASALVSMNSNRNSCISSKLRVLAFDFDKTCTKHPVLDIYKARADYHNEGETKARSLDEEWGKLVKFYAGISHKTLDPIFQDTKPMPTQFDEEGLRRFLEEYGFVDTLAADEVIKSNILKGITADGLRDFAERVELLPGVLKALQNLKKFKPLHVISLNFSKKLIEDVLNRAGTLPLVVHSNTLTFENGISTGSMDKKFLSASDKEIEFQRIIANSHEECGVSIYIGDSSNDLLALLKADVGLIIGKSNSMLKICHRFGIQVVPLHKWSYTKFGKNVAGESEWQQVLFSVQSWDEIKEFIFDFEHQGETNDPVSEQLPM